MIFDLHSVASLTRASACLMARADAALDDDDIAVARDSWRTEGLVNAVINDCEAEAGWQVHSNSQKLDAAARRGALAARLAITFPNPPACNTSTAVV